MYLYKIVFEDRSEFNGGTIEETRWNDIPINKKIHTLIYAMPDGNVMLFNKYDQYFHFIEVTKDINGDKEGMVQIESLNIIGRKGDKAIHYSFIVYDKRFGRKFGDIIRTEYNMSDDFIQKLNQSAWK